MGSLTLPLPLTLRLTKSPGITMHVESERRTLHSQWVQLLSKKGLSSRTFSHNTSSSVSALFYDGVFHQKLRSIKSTHVSFLPKEQQFL